MVSIPLIHYIIISLLSESLAGMFDLNHFVSFAKLSLIFLISLFALSPATSPSYATEITHLGGASEWISKEFAQVRLIALPPKANTSPQTSGQTSGQDISKTTFGAVEVKLSEGWKIYWRSPGEAGIPPELNWQGSQNLKQADFHYPVPERFSLFGITTYGYAKHVMFPISWVKKTIDAPLALRLSLSMLACKDICIPLSFLLDFNPDQPPTFLNDQDKQFYSHFSTRLPVIAISDQSQKGDATLSLTGFDWSQTPIKPKQAQGEDHQAYPVTLSFKSDYPLTSPDILIEGLTEWTHSIPEVSLSGDGHQADISFEMIPLYQNSVRPIGQKVTLTLIDRQAQAVFAIEHAFILKQSGTRLQAIDGTEISAPASAAQQSSLFFFVTMLGIAFIGGLILNLMPCVLPVLSLKILHFMSHAGAAQQQIRRSFLMSCAGILFSFWCLAAGAITLKLLGAEIGWGMQFQYPPFLIFLIIVLLVFAFNLFGLFQIILPSHFLTVLDRAMPSATSDSHRAAFLNGAFATLLATPCSAPFVGTAISFALSHGSGQIFLIFTCLGAGLAFPYLLIALFPNTARFLPKPGQWMTKVKYAMGGLLCLTAIWLGGVLLAPGFLSQSNSQSNLLTWQTFAPDRIPELTAEGRTILVDITADWCLTCKINDKLVFDKAEIAQQIIKSDIYLMRGDWTRPDPVITHFLTRYGRYGIPFNILYKPDGSHVILPELLQPSDLLPHLRAE